MGLFKRKIDDDKLRFITILNELKKEFKIDDNLYNHILNHYDIDKYYFNNNYLYIKNKALFKILYVKFKMECLNTNYEEISDTLNKISLLYIINDDDENSIFPSLYSLISKLVNEKYEYNNIYMLLLKIRMLFKSNDILREFIKNLLLIKDKESLNKFINIISELREICLEEELENMFIYIRNNIDKIDEELLINKIKINKHIPIIKEDISLKTIKYKIDYLNDDLDQLRDNIDDNNKYIEKQMNKIRKRIYG